MYTDIGMVQTKPQSKLERPPLVADLTYYRTASLTASEIYGAIAANCAQHRALRPMVAWTYPSDSSSPDRVAYAAAHLAADHAYAIVGCQWQLIPPKNNPAIKPKKVWTLRRHILLRDSRADVEGAMPPAAGAWFAWDASEDGEPGFWRRVSTPTDDGTFSVEAVEFGKYFAGFGVVE